MNIQICINLHKSFHELVNQPIFAKYESTFEGANEPEPKPKLKMYTLHTQLFPILPLFGIRTRSQAKTLKCYFCLMLRQYCSLYSNRLNLL